MPVTGARCARRSTHKSVHDVSWCRFSWKMRLQLQPRRQHRRQYFAWSQQPRADSGHVTESATVTECDVQVLGVVTALATRRRSDTGRGWTMPETTEKQLHAVKVNYFREGSNIFVHVFCRFCWHDYSKSRGWIFMIFMEKADYQRLQVN